MLKVVKRQGFLMRFNSVVLSAIIMLFGCSVLLADEQGWAGSTNPQPDKYRVFLFRFISARQGLQFLEDANIGTASVLNDNKTLLVTAQPEALIKAAALLKLVDSNEKYEVRALLPASEANRMPPMAALQQDLTNGGKPVSIGTFMNPPASAEYTKVIIDVHGNKLVAVAPASIMDKLVAIARRGAAESESRVRKAGPATGRARKATGLSDTENLLLQVGQTGSAEQQPDKAFKELLDSIAEAEKALKGQEQTVQKQPAESETSEQITAKPQISEEQKEPSQAPMSAQTGETPGPIAESQAAETGETEPNYNPYVPKVIPNADETLELALPEKLEIISLLDLAGKYLNLNYVYNPQDVKGKEVYLKLQGPVKVSELYPLVESVLKFTGLAMTRQGNLVIIASIQNALDINPVLIGEDKGHVQTGDVVVTSIFHLDYADSTQAKTILDGMKVGAVTALPGTLVVTGYAYCMKRVEELLDIIDKPGEPKKFKFRQLNYTLATNLAPKIKELVEQLGDMSIELASAQTATPTRMVRGRPVPVRRPTPQPATTATPTKPTIYLDADERTNRILMIGTEDELGVVEKLIDALDVAQKDIRSIRVYEIQHVGAEEVRKKLEELGIIGAERTTATRGRITARPAVAPGQPGAAPTPSPILAGTEAALPTEEVQVIVIESTNSLMVNASPEQHAIIATIISYVDSETLQLAIPYVVYPLENQNPADLADVLNKLIQETVLDKEGKIQQVVQRQEEQIVIVPDESTFSLIVFASKKNQEWIASLVKSLDRRRPQVLIDVTLVEVTKTDTFQYDLDLVSKLPEMAAGGHMTYLSSLLGNQGGDNPTAFPGGTVTELTSFSGQGQGFYSDKHIQALLTLMQEKSYGRILAKPKILVNDNEDGKIVAQQTTYVTRTSSIPLSTAQGTQTTTVTTSVDYQGYDAGITLDIKPHISEGDLLRLEIALTRSDFVGTVTGEKPPNTKSSDISTVVTVPDGSTIILGGLIKLNQNKGDTKVPLLGDIPLVGGLFRSVDNSVDDSKLYIFVKANILRPEATKAGLPELVKISDKNSTAFEKAEKEFQGHQSWPGIKPGPVDPVHVLDAE